MNKLLKFLPIAYFTALLFPMLAGAEDFISKNKYFSVPIKYPAFFLLLAILIPVLLKILLSHKGQELAKVYRNTMWITVPFLAVGMVSTIWGLHPDAYWERGLKFIILDLYNGVLLMFSVAIAYSWALRKYHRIIFLMVLTGACIAVWGDYFNPGTFSVSTQRAAGFTSNANDGARVIVLLCIAAVDWKKNSLINLIVLAFSGLTVFATLSVSNLLLYLSVVGYYLVLNIKGRKEDHFLKKVSLVAAVPLIIMFVIQPLMVNMMKSSDSFDNRTSQSRLDKISSFFRGDFSFAEDHQRRNLAEEYWELIFEAPVVGQGTGFSFARKGIQGTHNMYLKYWVENGLLGLLIYLSLVAGAFWHFYALRDQRGLIFVFVFFWAGFFSHNLMRDRTVVILLGIFGALAYLEKFKDSSFLKFDKTSAL